jgi:hypothetical protein
MFYWPSMKTLVKKNVNKCVICNQAKLEWVAYPGLLQPLPPLEGT